MSNTTLLSGVGHTPPWVDPDRIAALITTAGEQST
jgi:hypothetical protein